ncbi:translation initiation factor IF-2-like [Aquila chrysaetos chrysaetos]|uniref:translation initiation factor IF-2-like n=1 Tax=Aquila chrysaetos chrysaetos TaxID=223781 RepID=UPI001B7D2CE1|nr:translation initiation factor IF-2-like [Aquila chrysaetos chrysaetos]
MPPGRGGERLDRARPPPPAGRGAGSRRGRADGPELEQRRTETGGAGACALTGPARRGARCAPSARPRPAAASGPRPRARARAPARPYGQSERPGAGAAGKGRYKSPGAIYAARVGRLRLRSEGGRPRAGLGPAAAGEGPPRCPLPPRGRGRSERTPRGLPRRRRGCVRALPRLIFEPGELRGSFGPSSACPVGEPAVLESRLPGTAPRPVSLGRGGRRLRWGVVVSGRPVCLQAFQMSLFGPGVGSLFLPVEPLRKTEWSWKKPRSWQAAQERARRVGLCATSHCQDLLSTSLVCLMARIAVISGCRCNNPIVDAVLPLCLGGTASKVNFVKLSSPSPADKGTQGN